MKHKSEWILWVFLWSWLRLKDIVPNWLLENGWFSHISIQHDTSLLRLFFHRRHFDMSQKEKAEVKIILKKCCYKKLEHCDSMFMLKEKYYVYLRFIIVFWVTSRKGLQALNTSVFSDSSHLCNLLWLVSSCTPETASFTTTEQLSINSY